MTAVTPAAGDLQEASDPWTVADVVEQLAVSLTEAVLAEGLGFRGPFEEFGRIAEPLLIDAIGAARRDGAQIANAATEAALAAAQARIAEVERERDEAREQFEFAGLDSDALDDEIELHGETSARAQNAEERASTAQARADRLEAAWSEGVRLRDLLRAEVSAISEARDAARRRTGRLTEEVAAHQERADLLLAALRPFAIYAEHRPGRDFGYGEIGEYYHGGVRVSLRTQDLDAARTALARTEASTESTGERDDERRRIGGGCRDR